MVTQIIASELYWSPELPFSRGTPAAHIFRVSEYEHNSILCGGRLQVDLGKSFGPLSLDQVLMFCRLLEIKLEEFGSVAVATTEGDTPERTNVAVMLGAFLILRKRWKVAKVAQALGKDAGSGFSGSEMSARFMTVQTCWHGLELARDQGWIDGGLVDNQFATSFFCSQHVRTLQDYDAAWLVPSRIMVAAEPRADAGSTTAVVHEAFTDSNIWAEVASTPLGPDGFTYKHKKCSSEDATTNDSCSSVSDCSSSQHDTAPLVEGGFDDERESRVPRTDSDGLQRVWSTYTSEISLAPEEWETEMIAWSTYAGFKSEGSEYALWNAEMPDAYQSEEEVPSMTWEAEMPASSSISSDTLEDYESWCNSRNIALVVHTNEVCDDLLEDRAQHPRRHVNLSVGDGSVPDANSIRNFLESTDDIDDDHAVIVHCESGLGTSVVLACCHLINRYNVSGSALLGWVRIARPGAISTREQERFLCSLKGAADLQTYLSRRVPQQCCLIA